jgi:hypothetical protein
MRFCPSSFILGIIIAGRLRFSYHLQFSQSLGEDLSIPASFVAPDGTHRGQLSNFGLFCSPRKTRSGGFDGLMIWTNARKCV